MQIELLAGIFGLAAACAALSLAVLQGRAIRRQGREIAHLRRMADTLSPRRAETAPETTEAQRRRALEEERRFTEGIANILGYSFDRKGQGEA